MYRPTDPVGRLLFNVLAMVAEFEADLIRLRTKEGMRVAKAPRAGSGASNPSSTPRRKRTWRFDCSGRPGPFEGFAGDDGTKTQYVDRWAGKSRCPTALEVNTVRSEPKLEGQSHDTPTLFGADHQDSVSINDRSRAAHCGGYGDNRLRKSHHMHRKST